MKALVVLSAILMVSCANPQEASAFVRQFNAINQALVSYAKASTPPVAIPVATPTK